MKVTLKVDIKSCNEEQELKLCDVLFRTKN